VRILERTIRDDATRQLRMRQHGVPRVRQGGGRGQRVPAVSRRVAHALQQILVLALVRGRSSPGELAGILHARRRRSIAARQSVTEVHLRG